MLNYILLSTILIGLAGVGSAWLALNFFARKEGRLFLVISFAAGALVAVSFLELLPEALGEAAAAPEILLFALLGFIVFYGLSRLLTLHHCHAEKCEARVSVPLIVIGDTLHNFLDGLAVAAAFLAGWPIGLAASLAIVFHEIPQEIGDFGVLLHNGFSRAKALSVNLLSALACVLGGLAGFYFLETFDRLIGYILALTAGGFLYIGAADLLPQTHQSEKRRSIIRHTLAFLLGIAVIGVLGAVIKE